MIKERLVAYYGADPHHVRSDLDDIVKHGCTGIVFCITEIDVDLFAGRINAVMKGARAVGLDVYVDFWGLGGCFATNLMPSKYVGLNPDVRRTGYGQAKNMDTEDSVETSRACINNPKFLSWVKKFTAKVITTWPAKGVFWDEPKHGYCRCKFCEENFVKRFSRPMPENVDADVREMFNSDMTDLLVTLMANAKCADPHVLNMVCFMTTTQEELLGGNLEKLMKCRALDIYGTDPYWVALQKDFAWMRQEIEKSLGICERYGKSSHIWIQCHAIPKGRECEVYEAALVAAECGTDILAGWGFMGLNNNLWSANPEKCWDALGKAYLEISKKGVKGKR